MATMFTCLFHVPASFEETDANQLEFLSSEQIR